MKVYIAPTPAQHPLEGGILRVVNAMRKHLPAFGWDVVDNPAEADVINTHGVHSLPDINDKPVVQSSHGLMWYDYWKGGEWDVVNADLVAAMKRADAITAPSEWVARAIARGIACEPVVIHHGVDIDEWQPLPTQGYALWNKARGDEVSNPSEVAKLASLCPDVPFMSTIGAKTANLKVCGVVSYAEMKRIVPQAGVYLALPRETFGIGTLEAMACGVPVAGWSYGGQREIIRQGETGYLAPYGDYPALADCVRRCLSERSRLSSNARADVQERWGWESRIEQYAALYDQLVAPHEGPKVSVIVTSYNLGRFLPDALKSVAAQTWKDWECIVVDDCSSDNTAEIVNAAQANGMDVRYVRPEQNLGLPAARNFGIAQASGRYILPLDADDMLAPNALDLLSKAFDADKGLHIAYGHLDVCSEDGTQRRRSGWEVHGFDYAAQLDHHNQLHYSAMMRRSIWERTQGYRRRSWQAEDAEFWGYATSFGFNAQRVTDQSTLIYRLRSGSKSSTNDKMGTPWSDGDWSAWYTWRARKENTPFGAQGKPEQGFWRVPHHADPQVSIIIPVGPAHTEVLQDALDSVLAQTFTEWEVIVVNDTGQPLDQRGYAFCQWLDSEGGRGPGYCRNRGVDVARGELLVFLDADDILQPTFLEATIAAYRAEGQPVLVYTDWYEEDGRGKGDKVWKTIDWHWKALKDGMINCVTCLIPKAAHEAIGGFDEDLPGWEDYQYFLDLAVYGLCGKRVPGPLLTYRKQTGRRNAESIRQKETLRPRIINHYLDYFEGRKTMACSSCGGGRAKVLAPSMPPNNGATSAAALPAEGMVELEYIGTSETTLRFVGKKTQTGYRFGNNDGNRRRFVYAQDVPAFLTMASGPGRPAFRVIESSGAAAAPKPLVPLVVRDRQPAPAAPVVPAPQPARPVTANPPPAPLPQVVPLTQLPRMEVQPVPKARWEIEEEKKARARGVIVPRHDDPTQLEDGIEPVMDVAPMVMSNGEVPQVVQNDFAAPPHAVEAVPPRLDGVAPVAQKPLLEKPYADIRNAVPALTADQARAVLALEQAGKKRIGVINLLKVHIDAVSKEEVTA